MVFILFFILLAMNRFLVKKTRQKRVRNFSGQSYGGSKKDSTKDWRILVLIVFFVIFGSLIVFRLIKLQIINGDYYYALAYDQHELFTQLYPQRGEIYLTEKDYSNKEVLYPLAVNRELNLIYAVPKDIEDPEAVTELLMEILDFDDEIKNNMSEIELPTQMELTAEELEKEKQRLEKVAYDDAKDVFRAELLEKLSKKDDPYEPIMHRVSDEIVEKIKGYDLQGVQWLKERARYYPEQTLASHLLGFVGHTSENNLLKGYYGVEGCYDDQLAGEAGYLRSELDIAGRMIASAGKDFKKAQDGSDVVLTIDKAIEYYACEQLFFGVKNMGADSGSILIMEPQTGKILTMCSFPDFNPNEYNKVEDVSYFNNPVLLSSYEPGSVFKPITMAAALDAGEITPFTTYNDTGEVVIYDHTVKNSDEKAHGIQTMTQVLEKSLNTGTIFAVRKLGHDKFYEYVKNFGFGKLTDIDLSPESAGNLTNLDYKSVNDINLATASFGQGITVTPIQLVRAFAAIANEGKLVKPYVVEKIIDPNGEETVISPQIVSQVVSPNTARQVGSMMVSVVNNGHAIQAQVPGYLVAGKTGTAQVADLERGGYSDQTIHSFVGFAPLENPRFVMLVKLDNVKNTPYAADSCAPIFGKITKFILDYYNVAPTE